MCNYSNITIRQFLLQFPWFLCCFSFDVFLQSALLHTLMCFFKALYSILHTFFWKIILCSVISFSHSFYYICLCSTELCAAHMNRMWFITHIAVPVVGDLAYTCWREMHSLFFAAAADQNLGIQSGIDKMTPAVTSNDSINLDGNGGMKTHLNI